MRFLRVTKPGGTFHKFNLPQVSASLNWFYQLRGFEIEGLCAHVNYIPTYHKPENTMKGWNVNQFLGGRESYYHWDMVHNHLRGVQ